MAEFNSNSAIVPAIHPNLVLTAVPQDNSPGAQQMANLRVKSDMVNLLRRRREKTPSYLAKEL